MSNTVKIPRGFIVFGVCTLLAVLLGYMLSDPADPSSLVVVVLVLFVLSMPLLMRWHHPLLVLSWNMALCPFFLPGRPFIWLPMAGASMFFAVLNRSVNAQKQFLLVPSLVRPLLFFTAVIVATALLTGGFGLRTLGSGHYGGKAYLYILGAIVGFFAFTSERIPPGRAPLYVAMFFLPALTWVVAHLAYLGGPTCYFLFSWFPISSVLEQAGPDFVLGSLMGKWEGWALAAAGLYGFLFARYGLRGVLDLGRPWRCLVLLVCVGGCLGSGFRSAFIQFLLTFAVMFWLERLHRTRLLPLLAGAGLLLGAATFAQVHRLPFVVQRSLSFLPLPVDPAVRQNADDSTEWRIDMWRAVWPEIPRYLIRGKGYSLDPQELYFSQLSGQREGENWQPAFVAGDYHNGGLTILIPFGLFGVVGFLWFLAASLRYLHYNFRNGPPELRHVNTFLFAAFVAKAVFFFAVFGSFYSEFYSFTGLMGLSVSLNGSPAAVPETETPASAALATLPARV
jgi:hypothetical protein